MNDQTPRPPYVVVDATLAPPDPEVTALLREVVGEAPYALVEWDALRASIVGDATALFAQRVRSSWTSYVARWSRMAIPVGIAATLIAGAVTVQSLRTSSQATDAAITPAGVLNTVTGLSSGMTIAASISEPARTQSSSNDLLFGFDQ